MHFKSRIDTHESSGHIPEEREQQVSTTCNTLPVNRFEARSAGCILLMALQRAEASLMTALDTQDRRIGTEQGQETSESFQEHEKVYLRENIEDQGEGGMLLIALQGVEVTLIAALDTPLGVNIALSTTLKDTSCAFKTSGESGAFCMAVRREMIHKSLSRSELAARKSSFD